MTLSSMTGFGQADGGSDGNSWRWELKSVNGRGLDVRCRLPTGFETLEPAVRTALGKVLARGNVNVVLSLSSTRREGELVVNQAALESILAALGDLELTREFAPTTAAQILALRGVLETTDNDEDPAGRAERGQQMLASLPAAIDDLAASRAKEGQNLHTVLCQQVDQMAALALNARAQSATQTDLLRERVKTQVAKVLDNANGLDEARLHQEVAVLATKADVQEEIDRLDAHVVAAHDLLNLQEPVGRKLDFLTQEFNREANTLCAKSITTELTAIGLEMKTIIDQLREQVQNVE